MIPVSEPAVGKQELEHVSQCLLSGWISSNGRYIEEFEEQWASYCGRQHGVAVSSGTAALDLAVASLDLEPGDEVILPTFTIISCAGAVVRCGAVPVLVDADPETWTIDVAQVADRLTDRTRAIMPVHIYGHPVDMEPILELACDRNLAVIEDAAEAHGAEYRMSGGEDGPHWRRCGSFGTMSCFSFYANKIITTGEGGMVLTDDPALAARLRSLRNLCFHPERRFHHEEIGFNYRLTNLQAALGVAQLQRIEDALARRRWLGETYTQALSDISSLQLPVEKSWARNVYWMYGIVLRDEANLTAAELAGRLRDRGVDTRPFFLGMHRQPALRERGLAREEHYPVADRLAEWGLYLPSGATLTESQLGQVCQALREALS